MDATTIEQTVVDDFGECESVQTRVAPPGVTAIRWSLQDNGGLAGQVRVLDESIRELGSLRPRVGSGCVPQELPVIVSDSDCVYEVMAPTDTITILPADYTVHLEMLGENSEVLHETSTAITIPRFVPLIVSIGDSAASGEGNPDTPGDAVGNSCEEFTTIRNVLEGGLGPIDGEIEMTTEPVWLDARDHRSLASGPALGARHLLSTGLILFSSA